MHSVIAHHAACKQGYIASTVRRYNGQREPATLLSLQQAVQHVLWLAAAHAASILQGSLIKLPLRWLCCAFLAQLHINCG
jgi:hypothetical protein